MKTNYKDTELQAAIDEAFAKGYKAETHRFFLSPSSFYWDQEAPNRLTLIKAALAALPEPEPPTPEPLVTKPISLPLAEGMSLRDWFAGQALAMLADPDFSASPEDTAKLVYRIADAMLAAREVKP